MTTRPAGRASGGPARGAAVLTGTLLGAVALAGCGGDGSAQQGAADAGRLVFVEASATDCQLSKRGAPPGDVTFTVRNAGDGPVTFAVTSVESGTELGSVRVGRELLADLVVPLTTGDFVTLCTPAGTEEPLTADFVVTDTDPSGGY